MATLPSPVLREEVAGVKTTKASGLVLTTNILTHYLPVDRSNVISIMDTYGAGGGGGPGSGGTRSSGFMS